MRATESRSQDEWMERIASEFAQCPALRLTAGQASRLWALPSERTDCLLLSLVERGVLARTARGEFVRRGSCPRCE